MFLLLEEKKTSLFRAFSPLLRKFVALEMVLDSGRGFLHPNFILLGYNQGEKLWKYGNYWQKKGVREPTLTENPCFSALPMKL